MGRLLNRIFFKKKEKKPQSLRVLAVLCAVLLIGLLYAEGGGSKRPSSLGCNTGPFTSNESCISDSGEGWSFTASVGTIDLRYCDQMSLDAAELVITPPLPRPTIRLLKADCGTLRLENRDHYCYAAQRADAQAKIRYIDVLITDDHCGDAHFFQGQNILPLENEPHKARDWNTPFEGIPEIK